MTIPTAPAAAGDSPSPQRRSHRARWIIAASAVGVLVVGGAVAVAVAVAMTVNHRPDTGIVGCRAVASDIDHHVGGNAYTKADYDKQRQDFIDSRHSDLAQAGTAYLDALWTAYQKARAGDSGGIDYGAIVSGYNHLANACGVYTTHMPALNG